jgi:hypothetical protein
MTTGKYGTGLYYKTCLYSGSNQWVDGSLPGGNGELLVAICINKAIGQIDVAVDKTVENSTMTLLIDDKINEGLAQLGVDANEKLNYKIFFQSAHGTRLVPVFKRIHGNPTFLEKLRTIFNG